MNDMEYRAVAAEYEATLKALHALRQSLGLRPWDLEPWHTANPHPRGSPEHEQLEAVIAHGRDLEARWREAGERLDRAREQLLASEAAAAKAKR